MNARGDLGRTPLHYAVREGDAASVPIVAALLAHGADPTIEDDAGLDVAKAAREMIDSLDVVLLLLARPPSIADANAALAPAAARDAREPTVREVELRVGPPGRELIVRAYRSRRADGTRTTEVMITIAAPTADGGTMSHSAYPPLDRRALERFARSLALLRSTRRGRATLSVPEAYDLRLTVSALAFRFRARYAAAYPLDSIVHADLDDAALDALVAQARELVDALRAWDAIDGRI